MFEVLAFAIGCICGAMGYRYMLKKDPQKLEALAALAKAKYNEKFGK